MDKKDKFGPIPIVEHLRFKKNSVSGNITVVFYQDGEHYIVYSPTLDLSGYGSTEEEAKDMFDFSIEDYLTAVINLPQKTIEAELRKYGFKKEKFKTKNFRKMYVDENGVLQGLNQPELNKKNIKIQQFEVA